MQLMLKIFFFMLIGPVSIVVFFFLLILFNRLYYQFVKKIKPIPYKGTVVKRRSFWKRILVDLPNRIALDSLENDPNLFQYSGLHLFCGEQGSGKTMAVVEFLSRIRQEHPDVQIYSNAEYKYADGKITHWKQLIERTNGIYGVVEFIDEIQSWFSSNQSRNFPIEMLGEISQQRKQKKIIIGTAQVFGRVGKPIREQTSLVYLPMTIFKCLTIVRVTKSIHYSEEKNTFKKYEKAYFFIQDKELRDSYNTYERIKKYSEDGFHNDNVTRLHAE